jgi:hypothetical protein
MNPIHPIANDCLHTLHELSELLRTLNSDDYVKTFHILQDNSIGMHVRHVLEFYDCLMSGLDLNQVDYDARRRNPVWQSDVQEAINVTEHISTWLTSVQHDFPMKLIYHKDFQFELDTTLYRELAYNQEHSIHHMAIIRICLQQEFPDLKISSTFGVANSTLTYRNVLGKLSS